MTMVSTSGVLLFVTTASLIGLVLVHRDGVYAIFATAVMLATFMMRQSKQADACEDTEHGRPRAQQVAAKKATTSTLRADAAEFFPTTERGSMHSQEVNYNDFLKERAHEYAAQVKAFEKRKAATKKTSPCANLGVKRKNDTLAANLSSYQELLATGARTTVSCPQADETKVRKLLAQLKEHDAAAYAARLCGAAKDEPACRRMVAGSRETVRALHRGRAQAIVIASDVGADTKVKWITEEAKERGVPVLFGPGRRELGASIAHGLSEIHASYIAILHATGAEELFAEALTTQL